MQQDPLPIAKARFVTFAALQQPRDCFVDCVRLGDELRHEGEEMMVGHAD